MKERRVQLFNEFVVPKSCCLGICQTCKISFIIPDMTQENFAVISIEMSVLMLEHHERGCRVFFTDPEMPLPES